jgi:hypothetical protein
LIANGLPVFCIFIAANCYGGIMRFRKENVLLDLLLGAGVFLLDSLRERIPDADDLSEQAKDRYSDLRHKAKDVYRTVDERVGRAAEVIRGEDHPILSAAGAMLLGVGVGVGVGLLLAPASGEETRSNIKEKVRDRFVREKERATGTFGA